MNILVTGSNGQLGSEIRLLHPQYPQWNFLFLDLPELDITNEQSIDTVLRENSINIIINCAAYTAVDKAEREKELAEKVNVTGPGILAKLATKHNCTLIHVSTDFVFDGFKSFPYTEDDDTNPASIYGKTKALGEKTVLENCATSLVVRTSWLYSSFGNNFAKTMVKLGIERDQLNVIYEQVGTPTYGRDLALAILSMIEQNNQGKPKFGIYHYSNEGLASWYDFTIAIHELYGIQCKVKPILAKAYPLPAARPTYSVMDKSKIKSDFNIDIPYWRTSLKDCLLVIKQKQ